VCARLVGTDVPASEKSSEEGAESAWESFPESTIAEYWLLTVSNAVFELFFHVQAG